MKETAPTEALLVPRAIAKHQAPAAPEDWFEYPITVYPQHTDYSGGAWHGAYIGWLEEARVYCLRSIGVDFADLVAAGCDLPVVDLSVRYHRSLRMGDRALVRAKMRQMDGIRIHWDYEIKSPDRATLYLTGAVTLVPVDRDKGKIMRQLPAPVKDALVRLAQ
jgi:acyl-CoA thioester hydrolase